ACCAGPSTFQLPGSSCTTTALPTSTLYCDSPQPGFATTCTTPVRQLLGNFLLPRPSCCHAATKSSTVLLLPPLPAESPSVSESYTLVPELRVAAGQCPQYPATAGELNFRAPLPPPPPPTPSLPPPPGYRLPQLYYADPRIHPNHPLSPLPDLPPAALQTTPQLFSKRPSCCSSRWGEPLAAPLLSSSAALTPIDTMPPRCPACIQSQPQPHSPE
ncbi:hypothetical protein V8C86DRAFT_2529830, partial [Haematococcus lacustris]